MRLACLTLLLVSVCWALPFRQSGFLDFMMEDEQISGDGPPVVTTKQEIPPEVPIGPVCPFRCQCHLHVVQCSDLGNVHYYMTCIMLIMLCSIAKCVSCCTVACISIHPVENFQDDIIALYDIKRQLNPFQFQVITVTKCRKVQRKLL